MPPDDSTLILLALTVLRDAAERSRTGRVQGPDVRLALHVLRPHVRRQSLVEYWEQAGQEPTVWYCCHRPLRWVEEDLRRAGVHPEPASSGERATIGGGG